MPPQKSARANSAKSRQEKRVSSTLRRRAEGLKDLPIAYILPATARQAARRHFDAWVANAGLPPRSPQPGPSDPSTPAPPTGTTPLLTPDDERRLFLAMNYAKSQAAFWRTRLHPERCTAAEVARIERYLEVARRVRNEIVAANLRLVISVANHYVSNDTRLTELVSDGNVSLLQAVEKFDCTRGYRLSTYATWALRFNFNRSLSSQRRRNKRFVTGDDTCLAGIQQAESADRPEQEQRYLRRTLRRLLSTLDAREQKIIAARFGLKDDGREESLLQIAGGLGVCKERVRQLEIRALAKLRRLAVSAHLEPLCD